MNIFNISNIMSCHRILMLQLA